MENKVGFMFFTVACAHLIDMLIINLGKLVIYVMVI